MANPSQSGLGQDRVRMELVKAPPGDLRSLYSGLRCLFLLSLSLFASAGLLPRPLWAVPSSATLSLLVPRPREVVVQPGSFSWATSVFLAVEPGNVEDRFAAETFRTACLERTLPVPVILETATPPTTGTRLLIGVPSRFAPVAAALASEGLALPPEIGDQGYLLLTKPGLALIAATTATGVYYGLQTLAQLLPEGSERQSLALRITDWPTLPHRGLTVDYAQGEVQTLEAAKETVRRMGYYKLNVYLLYLEDAFLFPSHPDIGVGRDRWTTSEARDLSAYARRHHVEVIPCYDCPGHMENTLAVPAYQRLREGQSSWYGVNKILNIAHPDALALMRGLFRDLCVAFPDASLVHMGGDEAYGICLGESWDEAQRYGKETLYRNFLLNIRDTLTSHGKQLIVATDMFEPAPNPFFMPFGMEAVDRLPRDVVLGPWHYGSMPAFQFGDDVTSMGFRMQLWTSNASYGELFPVVGAAWRNVESYLPHGHRLHTLGGVHSDWDVAGKNTLFEYGWPANAHYAEWAWENPGRTWTQFSLKAAESFYGPGTWEVFWLLDFLGNLGGYFGWGGTIWTAPGGTLFYAPLEPYELDATKLYYLNNFRISWSAARQRLDRVRMAATRNRDHLDYFDYALAQEDALADLIELRHVMALFDPASRARERALLEKLYVSLPRLIEQFQGLWLRTNKPLGLQPCVANLEAVFESVRQRLLLFPAAHRHFTTY